MEGSDIIDTGDETFTENVSDDPLVSELHTIAKAGDKRKAEQITALRVSHLTVTTEFFVTMVGNSRPQNQAIAAAIQEDMEEFHGRTGRLEGTADSGWILLDFGDIIINVMTPRSREVR
jgi:ribosome-associated protein